MAPKGDLAVIVAPRDLPKPMAGDGEAVLVKRLPDGGFSATRADADGAPMGAPSLFKDMDAAMGYAKACLGGGDGAPMSDAMPGPPEPGDGAGPGGPPMPKGPMGPVAQGDGAMGADEEMAD